MNDRLPPSRSKHLRARPTQQVKIRQPPAAGAGASAARKDGMLLRQALELQKAKRFPEAEELCHRVLARTPEHPLALYIMGTLGLDFEPELAIQYFERAATQEPSNPFFQLSLGEAWLIVGEYPSAIRHLRRACELKPDLVEAYCKLAQAYTRFGKPELALPIYERALEVDRNHPLVRMGIARTLISLGRMDEASIYLKENIARRVAVADAYYALVGTQKYSTEPPELTSVLDEMAKPAISADSARSLHFAAGKILNDLQRYSEAMDHFMRARTSAVRDYDIDYYRKRVNALIDLFDPKLLAAKQGYGDPSDVPVFVLGMPRSGTTLAEQILASHPRVHGAGELTKMERIAVASGLKSGAKRLFGEPVRSLTISQSQAMAKDYLSSLSHYSSSASRIVDKMPHNFELVGLIAILFPSARIIHCRRNAIDNCISCFTSDLREGHSYSYDLETLGAYYREYDRLMRHWEALLPGRIFQNRYEDMVSDQEGQSRRLIDHVGLAWDDACLWFFDNPRSVETPSRWQVRQPIYTSSVKRWQNYEGRIKPLIDALGDLAEL